MANRSGNPHRYSQLDRTPIIEPPLRERPGRVGCDESLSYFEAHSILLTALQNAYAFLDRHLLGSSMRREPQRLGTQLQPRSVRQQ